jgi:hypothetical protein
MEQVENIINNYCREFIGFYSKKYGIINNNDIKYHLYKYNSYVESLIYQISENMLSINENRYIIHIIHSIIERYHKCGYSYIIDGLIVIDNYGDYITLVIDHGEEDFILEQSIINHYKTKNK